MSDKPAKKGYRWYAGDQWPENWRDDHIELWLFGTSSGEKQLGHFKKWVSLQWPEPVFMWDEWCDLFFGAACGAKETVERVTGEKIPDTDTQWHKRVVSTGAASCVAGHTKIYNPISGKSVPIEQLYREGNPSHVMTMNGVALASAPFIKGIAELFEVTMTDGTKFTATSEHRVFSPSGFVRVGELREGSWISGYEPILRDSISGIGPQAQAGDVHRCSKTVPDSQSCCHPSPCSYDELLRLEAEDDQDDLTLQAGVLAHIYRRDGERLGVRGSKQEHIHICHIGAPPSNYSDHREVEKMENSPQFHSRLNIDAREFLSFRQSFQFPKESNSCLPSQQLFCDFEHRHYLPCSGAHTERPNLHVVENSLNFQPFRQSFSQSYKEEHQAFSIEEPTSGSVSKHYLGDESHQYSSEYHMVRLRRVQEIKSVGEDIFYDLTVPKYHHYFAEGCIHHNTGKSSKAALWILGKWLCAQAHTSVVLTSTSLDQLKRRIWSELCEWIQKAKYPFPLEIVPSDTEIRYKKGDKKNAIFGIAVKSGGDAQEAVDRIKGIHNRRVFVVIDEMTSVPVAIISACNNLNKGTLEFQLFGLGNALPGENPHTTQCEPLNGWNSVTVDNQFWLTSKGGCCIHFDGHKSPALRDPKKFHFYINKEQMDADQKEFGGENTPEYWTNDRGFWPPTGLSNTVMDVAMLDQFDCQLPAVWKSGWEMCAMFDPAFEGGDRRVLQPFKLGMFANGITGIEYQSPIIVAVDMSQDTRWIHYQIADAVQNLCENYECNGSKHPILPRNFIADTTGEGGGLFSIMSGRWSPQIQSLEFGGAAEKTQIYPDRPTTYHEIYGNKVTMLHYVLRRFIEGGQIRGLRDSESRDELTKRQKFSKSGKTHVQPKAKMKGLSHRSPDKGDACVGAAELMRRKGIEFAGKTGSVPKFNADEWNEQADKLNISEEENDYADNEGAYV